MGRGFGGGIARKSGRLERAYGQDANNNPITLDLTRTITNAAREKVDVAAGTFEWPAHLPYSERYGPAGATSECRADPA